MTLNNQPIEKIDRTYTGNTLDVHSIFSTIQGEGPFCGEPATFIRLAGCNLQCPWCDTEYTQGRRRSSISYIVDAVAPLGNKLVVVTGGEPFRQKLGFLFDALVHAGYYVQVETNGTLPPPKIKAEYRRTFGYPRRGVFIVCSPKTGKINDDLLARCCALKYVLDSDDIGDDGLPNTALGHTANPRLARPPRNWGLPVYLQPADHKDPAKNQANLEAAVRSCRANGFTLQLQIHKYLGLE